jgi:hypothetical protein
VAQAQKTGASAAQVKKTAALVKLTAAGTANADKRTKAADQT